jgi:hypothetical protein
MTDKIVIRPSALTGWLDCSRRAATALFWKEIRAAGFTLRSMPRNVGAAVGTSVHKGAWLTLDTKLRTGEIGADKDATEIAVETFRAEVADGVMWDELTNSHNTAAKQIERMTRVYRVQVAPKISPIKIEERLEATIGEVVISGQKDCLCREPADLRDLKTGKRASSHAAQLGAYSLLERSHGGEVTGLKEDYIRRGGLKQPQPDVETLAYDPGVCEHLAMETIDDIRGSVIEFRERLKTGRLPPENAFRPNPNSVLCSDKWCPAWGTKFCGAHRPK